MFDPWSTTFTEVQRESYRGAIGRQAYDQQTYEVLLGPSDAQPVRRRRVSLRATLLTLVPVAAVAVYWLAQH